jgi:hypothetical protein
MTVKSTVIRIICVPMWRVRTRTNTADDPAGMAQDAERGAIGPPAHRPLRLPAGNFAFQASARRRVHPARASESTMTMPGEINDHDARDHAE